MRPEQVEKVLVSGMILGTTSFVNDFSLSHYDAMMQYHGTAAFLPWHRYFLLNLEEAMRKCTGNKDVYIPYWDNSLDSQAPERSLIWKFFGGNGDPNADQGEGPIEIEEDGFLMHFGYCVSDGPFANVKLIYSRRGNARLTSEPDCLRRQFGTDHGDNAAITSYVMNTSNLDSSDQRLSI
jgi:hypothetical protein